MLTAGVVMMLAGAGFCTAAPEDAPRPEAPVLSTEISGRDLVFFTGMARETALVAGLSELAEKHAVTPEVQALAAAVDKDEAAARASLTALAGRKQVPVAVEPDGEGKKQLLALGKLKGPKFDKSYLDALADAQDEMEKSLEAGAASADGDIKAAAQAAQGTLKEERERVRKLGF